MSPAPPSISAVLPAFNEAAVIEDTVRRTHEALRRHRVAGHELVVVDDGSNDGTGDMLRRLTGELPATVLLVHPRNLGHGVALRTGFEAAHREAVWLLDSDGPFDPRTTGSATGARPEVVARAFVELWGLRTTAARRHRVLTAESPLRRRL